jgi:putative restriction endonuclease
MIDSFVFKKLSHNDTGKARGHQGGVVIPKDIAKFFPALPAVLPGGNPTVDVRLTADLFVDGSRLATVETRYQHQTWGGTRSAERRLTDNLGPLRNLASEDDILLFSKDLEDDRLIRLHLVRKTSAEYDHVRAMTGPRRWGVLDLQQQPVSVEDTADAERYINDQMAGAPTAFGPPRALTETTTARKARDRAFRAALLSEYGSLCAFTDRGYTSPVPPRIVGLDAAHIVPVEASGSDHPANGLLLAKDIHWAFDRGLIGVSENREIIVPDPVRNHNGNEFLGGLHGKPIREARSPHLRVLEEALAWHRNKVLVS